MRSVLCGLVFGAFWIGAAQAGSAGGDWPGWRGPNRDGKSLETGLLKEWPDGGPKLLWQVNDIGVGFSSVAVTGGTVYISGDKGGKLVVFALDLEGKQKWQAEHGEKCGGPDGSRSTPVIDGGLLYIINGAGLIGCYDAKTGDKKWTREMKEFGGRRPGWSYSESVLIYKNLAIVTPGGPSCIVALDKATGEKVWASEGFNGGAQYGSCIAFTFEGVPLIVNGTHGGIVGVDARDGKVHFSDNWSAGNTANCTTPVYADGHVFWSNGYGKGGVCLKLKADGGKVSAERAWTTDFASHHGGYIVKDGYIYGDTGRVACLDLKTGEKKWQAQGMGKGSLCYADGMLYLFGEGGGRAALATCSPEKMEIKGQVTVKGPGNVRSWAHPVVAGGRLYLRYDTNLYCFDVKGQ
ncbi:MAG: polyvinylalcohol dehydrogenase [Planctomycetes bacterium]|nr:polyvinylalcohol dehydrogenase [Planctomycetota bacterium]